jgi:hypothetical protein
MDHVAFDRRREPHASLTGEIDDHLVGIDSHADGVAWHTLHVVAELDEVPRHLDARPGTPAVTSVEEADDRTNPECSHECPAWPSLPNFRDVCRH